MRMRMDVWPWDIHGIFMRMPMRTSTADSASAHQCPVRASRAPYRLPPHPPRRGVCHAPPGPQRQRGTSRPGVLRSEARHSSTCSTSHEGRLNSGCTRTSDESSDMLEADF